MMGQRVPYMTRWKVLRLMVRRVYSVGRGGVVCRDRYSDLYNGYSWRASIAATGFRDPDHLGELMDRMARNRRPPCLL